MKPAEPSSETQLVWRQVTRNCLVYDGVVYPIYEEITCSQAAKILGLHRVTVSKFCDEGRLKEGEHWRRIGGDRSRYLIRRQVIMEMRLQRQREAERKGHKGD